MGFATLWPGFSHALKRDLSNLQAHPNPAYADKVPAGDGTWRDISSLVGGTFEWTTPPLTATSTGTADQAAYDENYFYICIDTDTWRRIPLSEW